jgi:hypothetical protein
MATISETDINISLAFPKAGVTFAIKCGPPDGSANGHASSFNVTALDSGSSQRLKFNEETSPQLADWIKGYTRWLRRASVTASYDENGITGSLTAGLTPEQSLANIQVACDMIRQRFELYDESILG